MKTVVLFIAISGALLAARRELPWEKNHLEVGQALYRENCVVCHDVDKPQKDSKKLGPSFYQLFKREQMPMAKQPPNRAYILTRMKFGGAIMPAFAKRMTAEEMETLLDYIQSK
jgi:mono/diheme cytochrome c family protein